MTSYAPIITLLSLSFSLLAGEYAQIDTCVERAIREHIFPGAVLLINYQDKTLYHKAFGRYTYDTHSPVVTTDTLFDIASLTKVVATTTLTKKLCDERKISLEDLVTHYIPEFKGADVRITHVLTHTSGIREQLIQYSPNMTADDLWRSMLDYPIEGPAGTHYQYACTNAILLQKIIEKTTGLTFEECIKKYITEPLEMSDTRCHPPEKSRCAPTRAKTARGETIQGEVNDDRTFILGGCAGNAGLFSTARDLEKFMRMISLDCARYERPVAWTQRQCQFNRGYGWEIGRHLSPKAFGHFGWTGTSIWADKELQLFCIILTNHTYPDDTNRPALRAFREQFHDLIVRIFLRP